MLQESGQNKILVETHVLALGLSVIVFTRNSPEMSLGNSASRRAARVRDSLRLIVDFRRRSCIGLKILCRVSRGGKIAFAREIMPRLRFA